MKGFVRDRLLSVAAGFLAAGYFLAFSADLIRARGFVVVPAFALLLLAGLALGAGFAIISFGFARRSPARDAALRNGLRTVAGGYALTLAASSLPPFSRFGPVVGGAGYLAGRAALLAAYLAWMAAAVVAAGAFPTRRADGDSGEAVKRARRLGQASAVFAAGAALRAATGSLSDLLLLVAGLIAAAAFFLTASRLARGGSHPRPGRDLLLCGSAACLAVGYGLAASSTLSVLRLQPGTGGAETAFYLLTWGSALCPVVAAVAAVVGLALSARFPGTVARADPPRRGGGAPKARLPE